MNAIIILAIAGIASMFIGIFNLKRYGLPLVTLACLAAIGITIGEYNGDYSQLLHNMMTFDAYAKSFSIVMIFVTLGVLSISKYYYDETIEHLNDIYALFIFSLIGGLILIAHSSLVMLFLGTEILSIPLYILSSSNRKNLASNEAGLKYYLLGSFASCFLLLGITLLYGMTGSFELTAIQQYIQNQPDLPLIFIIGCVFIIGAFMFKLAVFPFHFWAPDVYQGAPTVLTVFLATTVKIIGFGTLIRFISLTMLEQVSIWQPVLITSAILTMVIGAIISLYQTNFKRLLAYSGIANAGFILVVFIALKVDTFQYVLYYFLGYSIASILGFSLYSIIKENSGIDDIRGLKGLIAHNKLLTTSLIIVMLSFAGIPPLAGFLGKYFILFHAIDTAQVWLLIIALIASFFTAYNYLKVLTHAVQIEEGQTIQKIYLEGSYRFLLITGIVLLFFIGLFPDIVMSCFV